VGGGLRADASGDRFFLVLPLAQLDLGLLLGDLGILLTQLVFPLDKFGFLLAELGHLLGQPGFQVAEFGFLSGVDGLLANPGRAHDQFSPWVIFKNC
jgi:hypothetical protein